MTDTCEHGSSCDDFVSVRLNDLTQCCNAHTSIFTDDGVRYCKCCYATVTTTGDLD